MKKLISVLLTLSVFMFMGLSSAMADGEGSPNNIHSPSQENTNNNNPNISGSQENIQSAGVSAIFEASDGKRNVPNAVLPGFPQGPSYFSDVPMTHEYLGIEDLAKLKYEWREINIKAFGNWNDGDMDLVNLKEKITANYLDKSDRFKISFINPNSNNMVRKHSLFVGIITVSADDKEATSETLFSVIGKRALENGANLVYPINQGAQRVLNASATGVALGYTHIVMGGGSERTAGAGTLGIGYSTGETKYSHSPFLRVAIYKVDETVYDNLKIFPNGNNQEKQTRALQQKVRELQEKVNQYQKQNN